MPVGHRECGVAARSDEHVDAGWQIRGEGCRDRVASLPVFVEAINQQPVLKRNRIVIRTLADYFMYVVVPSRANVHLDELDFADSHRVKAIMYVGDRPVLLYQLEKIREKWKISTW